ncbi:MAG: hypothetical protein MK085_10755 [Phycisphaerales bacterium]|nr:hypothetical protein [Phycisphaerales bacterium]
MPSKDHLISAIREHNHGAHRDWLVQFDAPALRIYLDHLQYGSEPRGGNSVWVRPGDTRACVTRRAG